MGLASAAPLPVLSAKEAVSDDRLAALLVTVIGRQHDDAARSQPGAISWRCIVGLRSSISGRSRTGGRRGRHASQPTADRRRPSDARGAARLGMLHGVPDHRIADRPGDITAEARPRSFRLPMHNLRAILALYAWMRSGVPPSRRTIRRYFVRHYQAGTSAVGTSPWAGDGGCAIWLRTG